jgi:hypothetical protein
MQAKASSAETLRQSKNREKQYKRKKQFGSISNPPSETAPN